MGFVAMTTATNGAGLKSNGMTRQMTGYLVAHYRAILLSTVDRFNDNNSVLVQFTLPAVDSLIHSGRTFANQKHT